MESVAKNVRELNVLAQELPFTAEPTAAAQNPVNQLGDNATNRSPPTCYKCGKPGHYASSCKYKETVCNKCDKVRSKQSKPTKSHTNCQ